MIETRSLGLFFLAQSWQYHQWCQRYNFSIRSWYRTKVFSFKLSQLWSTAWWNYTLPRKMGKSKWDRDL